MTHAPDVAPDAATDAVIIGAGPAGLAVGACLRRAGLDFVLLEKAPHVGASWRGHYDRLRLHTVKRLSALPHLGFPAAWPRYVPRRSMVEYLETYAAHFELRPRFGETVRAVRRAGGVWRVDTDQSATGPATTARHFARHVVVASGLNAEPVVPDVPGIAAFAGPVSHSADYANAAPYAGKSVLVVGMGNTGAEIALDLAEGGARPTLSVRDGVHIVPRDLFGLPIQVVATVATRLLPMALNDRLFPPILDLALGRPETLGLRRPEEGLLHRIARGGRVPVLDVGTVAKIAEGAIAVAPGVASARERSVVFADGSARAFDAIVFATGFRPGYPAFVEAADMGAATLHFAGFTSPVTGQLREIARDAVRIAGAIAAER